MIAIHHQNIIGWDNFLWGYMSSYWLHIFQEAHLCDVSRPNQWWDIKLVEGAITLSCQTWADWNVYLHGSLRVEEPEAGDCALLALLHNPAFHAPVSGVDGLRRVVVSFAREESHQDCSKVYSLVGGKNGVTFDGYLSQVLQPGFWAGTVCVLCLEDNVLWSNNLQSLL